WTAAGRERREGRVRTSVISGQCSEMQEITNDIDCYLRVKRFILLNPSPTGGRRLPQVQAQSGLAVAGPEPAAL
ncbi:hypothetical protein, partial [Escherichia coli]|uniref:hypothetical protein n=1 Tax=Escherichia coli TaxID=562 RepID=UPI00390CA61B